MIYSGNSGYLKIIIGPMFSGKTSELINISRLYKLCNISSCIINYNEDTRYGPSDLLATHDNIMVPCISRHKLAPLLENAEFLKNRVILINEAQFFTDLYHTVKELIEKHNKIIYVCGLDGDFRREKFGQIFELIPMCDEIIKKSALCMICRDGNKAIFTHRLTCEVEQKIIGSANYQSLCRNCFKKQFKLIK
jgi:thymidine kinase